MFDLIIKYGKQSSTYKGFIAIATALGATVSQEQAEAIIASGIALIGLIEVFTDENKK